MSKGNRFYVKVVCFWQFLNCTHIFVTKISSKRELQQIPFNQSLDIDFEDFINLYKKCIAKPYVLVIDTTLTSDNPLNFRNNLF